MMTNAPLQLFPVKFVEMHLVAVGRSHPKLPLSLVRGVSNSVFYGYSQTVCMDSL